MSFVIWTWWRQWPAAALTGSSASILVPLSSKQTSQWTDCNCTDTSASCFFHLNDSVTWFSFQKCHFMSFEVWSCLKHFLLLSTFSYYSSLLFTVGYVVLIPAFTHSVFIFTLLIIIYQYILFSSHRKSCDVFLRRFIDMEIHCHSNVWGHLEISLFLKEKHNSISMIVCNFH